MADLHPVVQPLLSRSPLDDGFDPPGSQANSTAPGVTIRLVRDRSATLIASGPRSAAALERRLHEALGIALPGPGRCSQKDGIRVLWQGPARWLVLAGAESGTEERLRAIVGRDAAVIDQSGALVSLHLEGSRVRAALSKILPIDLHPRVFARDDTRSTAAGHIGIQIVCVEDTPCYLLLIPRSTAPDFARWLIASSAEFGVGVE
ncbi:sarcosine oxidase subunit gamma [Aquamicrobium defluvii]|uniref:N-methylglutamate dehydrogenase subunit D n=1 Tax=Aquamicrobium defluvii TaxID=69279 RepID=A0A4V3DKB1_9HYPH|nr:sarcosine oxidase subunit gamma family protein [Aquamicrobium defluvii]TDR33531.1 N-methylglutamate dehydrogenase subunit D [Aquamicrobium defluvii]